MFISDKEVYFRLKFRQFNVMPRTISLPILQSFFQITKLNSFEIFVIFFAHVFLIDE